MNFTEIVSAIISRTKRPDKVNEIRNAVNAALLTYSSDDDYANDLQEVQYSLPVPGTQAAIPIAATLPRLRKIAYIKVTGSRVYAKKLETLMPEPCIDLRNKWYAAGSNINVNLANSAMSLDIGYYAYPPYLTDAVPTHWMLEGNWNAIMQKALSDVYTDIGDGQEAAKAERNAGLAYSIFKNSQTRG